MPPDYLYKYQELSAYSLASLINGTIWLAKPKTFNDPFDCAISLYGKPNYKGSDMDVSELMEKIKSECQMNNNTQDHLKYKDALEKASNYKDALEKAQKTIDNIYEESGICSFSAKPDHLLMWSHYANHHRGFCIEYDCREGTKLRKFACQVKYEDSMPKVIRSDLAPTTETNDALWLTKARCWSYEEEWRIIEYEGGNMSYFALSTIVSVIFGERMPESDRSMITHALRHEKNIQFKKAVLRKDHFLIDIVDI